MATPATPNKALEAAKLLKGGKANVFVVGTGETVATCAHYPAAYELARKLTAETGIRHAAICKPASGLYNRVDGWQ